jgi:PAS domain S-box-containing protein
MGQPLLPPLTGRDEIASLDTAFHQMAKTIEETSRKQRAIVDNALDVICSIDKDEKFTGINPACSATWGYAPEDLIGRRYTSIVASQDIDATRSACKAAMTEQSVTGFINRITRKDGGQVDMQWSMYWSQTENSLFCVAHDITERRMLDRMKQEFVQMVSHDLRTPLTSVRGALSLLMDGAVDPSKPQGQKRILDAQANVDRLINLINDLLDIEKLESGGLTLAKVPVDLKSAVVEAVENVRGYSDQQGVELEDSLVDATVLADRDRLIQVVVNLLSNAVKFSEKGQTVTIQIERDGDRAKVLVVDRGRGIPKDKLGAIFDRFHQVQSDDRKRGVGTGLGLAICKSIVEGHGGSIGVASENGAGSTFWFSIPVVDPTYNTLGV